MNRHERRRLKKTTQVNYTHNNELMKGIQYHTNKDYDKAKQTYESVLAKDSRNYDALRHMGILYQDLENYERAYEYFMQSIKARPSGFESLNNLGTIHTRNKNYPVALQCYNKSLNLNPEYVPTINNLASLLYRLNKPKEALEFSSKALKLQPNNPNTLNQHAKALILNNRIEEAINILKDCHKKYPNREDFKSNLATAYREIGEFDKANKMTVDSFNKDFKNISILTAYISNKKNLLSDEHIQYYNNKLDQSSLSIEEKVIICHSLYGDFKNKKNYSEAAKYLVRGNELQYSLKEFDLDEEKYFFDEIKNMFNENQKLKIKENKGPSPIFVCGMPRSGTTLCEQILSSHSQIEGAGELSYLSEVSGINKIISPSREEIENFKQICKNPKKLFKVRENYLESLRSHSEKNVRYICDKMPHNFILIGLIRLILPDAKVIYCKRDPIDNCFSLYNHKFTELSHQYSYDQKTLAAYYHLHRKLMNYWLNLFGDEIFVLDNENLVNNQEKVSKELIKFLNVDWEKECLDFYKNKRQVRTASIEQVRQPMNKKSIGAWKNYKSHLSDLVSNLKFNN